MARNNPLQKQKEKDLKFDYNRLSTVPVFKKEPWRIYKYLRTKYYITNKTIDAILGGEYDRKRTRKQIKNEQLHKKRNIGQYKKVH